MRHQTLEKQLKFAIADFMRLQYPDIPFRIDYDQLRLPVQVQVQVNRLKSVGAWPDMFIPWPNKRHNGLFVEIKKSKSGIYLKNGITFRKNKHLTAQIDQMQMLRQLGYTARFCWSLESFQQIMKEYLIN